ncbi:cobalt-precorrin-6A reductase [Anderseniella sp. Alg231-50]|uniref:cobalt-precorrin-6A reductase n=1 Tax=Anderseniella sp. Alg231-50 TaxID=1922226 RepID=UPI000D55C180
MSKPFRILLLAGTFEARQLAEQLSKTGNLKVIASLAGATQDPKPYPVETRTGGFGGAEGLARYIDEQGFDLILNASHPFARVMCANAANAAMKTRRPLLRLLRDPWRPADGDQWLDVADMADAVAAVPDNARVLFATGRGSVEQIAAANPGHRLWGAIRLIDQSNQQFPLQHGEFILARPPFPLEEELDLMRRFKISHLVTKNAGGCSGRAKLQAARELGVKVIAIRRPRQPDGQVTAATVQDLMAMVFDIMSQSEPDKA